MRTLLTLALSLLAPLSAFAASPTFSSFATNDFVVTTNLSGPWVITANRFGVTNAFTNFTIINTNVFISNNYTTNITDNSLVIYTNSTVIYTNTTVTINGTNVATINPTDTLLPYRVDSNTFGDSSLKWLNALSLQGTNLTTKGRLEADGAFVTGLAASYALGAGPNTVTLTNASLVFLASLSSAATVELTTGSAIGARVLLLNSDTNFSLTLTNSALVDDAGQSVTVAGGYWTPTSLGESIQLVYTSTGWFEEGRFNPNVAPPSADDHLVFASGFDEVPGSLITKVNAGLGITTGIEGDTDDHLIIGLEPSMIHWTNSAGTLQTTLTPDGTNVFTIDPNTGWTGTGTNYFGDDGKFHGTAINTNGGNLSGSLTAPFLPYATGTDTLADSPVRREDAWNVRSTNLITEHRLITEGAFITTNLSTATLSTGTNILVLTNKAMLVLAAVDPSGVVVQLTSGNGSGQHVWLVNYYTNATFTLPSGVCFDDTNKVVVIRGDAWTPTETGESIELLGMPQGWIEINRANPNGPAPITGTNYWTNIASVLQPIDLTLPLMITNQIRFGPGDTNVLYRIGTGWALTNGASNWHMDWLAGDASGVRLQLSDGSLRSLIKGVGGMQAVGFGIDGGSDGVIFQGTSFLPLRDNTTSLATANSTTWWKDLALAGTAYVGGFDDHAGNYSRLAIFHSGTNGVGDGIVFDSRSAGDAGAARDFLWQSNGVTVAKIAANSGYTGSGTRFLNDAGTYTGAVTDPTFNFPPVGGVTGTYVTNIYATNLSAGAHTIFTVPANYRAFGVSGLLANPTNTSSIILRTYLKISGTNYLLSGLGLAATTNTPAVWTSSGLSTLFEAGDELIITNSATGLSYSIEFKLFPDTAPLKTARLLTLSTTPTLLYTVPASSFAYPMPTGNLNATVFGGMRFGNNSAANRFYKVYLVPPGAAADDSTLVISLSATTDLSIGSVSALPLMEAGYKLYVSSDATTDVQWTQLPIYEYTP